jgi:hypothetical protein
MMLAFCLLALFFSLPLMSQSQTKPFGKLTVRDSSLWETNDKLHMKLCYSYSTNLLNRGEKLYVSPVLSHEGQQALFPSLVFDGKSKKVLSGDRDVVVKAGKVYDQYLCEIEYINSYTDWMQNANLCFTSTVVAADGEKNNYVDCVYDQVEIDSQAVPQNSETTSAKSSKKRRFPLVVTQTPQFALRTNLLLPLMNIGVVVPIGNRWSVGADWYYPWALRSSSHKNCFQLAFLTLEGRYWLGSKHKGGVDNKQYRLRGHSLGAFVATGKYDFERNYKGDQGEFYAAGIDYLYAMPVFKGKLNLEFSLGVGFMHASAYEYTVYTQPGGKAYHDNKNFRKVTNYAGPIKGSIALVLPLKFRKSGK